MAGQEEVSRGGGHGREQETAAAGGGRAGGLGVVDARPGAADRSTKEETAATGRWSSGDWHDAGFVVGSLLFVRRWLCS